MNENNQENAQQKEPVVKGGSIKWLTFGEWLKQFDPVIRDPGMDTSQDACFLRTNEPELEFVKVTPDDKLWTLVDCGSESIIVPGYKDSISTGYFVSNVAWKNDLIRIVYTRRRFVTTPRLEDTDFVGDDEFEAKMQVGAQCNRLLDLADTLDTSTTLTDQELAEDIRSIVNRVSDFDELIWGGWQPINI